MISTFINARRCKLRCTLVVFSLLLLGACAEEQELTGEEPPPEVASDTGGDTPSTQTPPADTSPVVIQPPADTTPVVTTPPTDSTPVVTTPPVVNPPVSSSTRVSNPSPATYTWATLQVGLPVYIDRAYTYTSIPNQYLGLDVLQTANNDKTSTNSPLISFTLNAASTVYIAYDNRIATPAAWLSSWIDMQTIVDDSDPANQRVVFAKDFTAGATVNLGPNSGGNTSLYTVFVGPAIGAVAGTQTPVANNDNASTISNQPVTIDVLANDTGIADTPILISIIDTPNNGSAVVSNNQIVYTPDTDFGGNDSFSYRISDKDSDTATATVDVSVDCGNCAVNKTVLITWNANTDIVNGYKVYFGSSASTVTTLARDVSSGAGSTQSVSLNGWQDLGLDIGNQVCISVSAYNIAGESAPSAAACGTL